MTLSQNILLDEISNEVGNGSCGSLTRSLGQNVKKPCVHLWQHFQTDNHETCSEYSL